MWTFHHAVTFFLTFFSYAFFHATRKTFSNVKTTISEEWSRTAGNSTLIASPDYLWQSHHMFETAKDAETYLGVLDAVFMVSYAVGLYISGIIGDRFDMRKVLSIGMCSTAIFVFLFGPVLEWGHFYNRYLYVALWILNGLLQSSGWPTVVAVMGNWFGKSSRGFILGLWSACASVGNIIGALMVSQVLHFGYEYAFLFTASVLFSCGIINFFSLVSSPKELGLPVPDEDDDGEEDKHEVSASVNSFDHSNSAVGDGETEETDTDPLLPETSLGSDKRKDEGQRAEALSFCQALLLPGVILYALAYFCLKLVNYSFFFWLPYYLGASFNWAESTADKISIWYDIGGIIGGTVAGLISDCFKRRSVVVVPMLVIAIPALFGYSHSPNDMTVNAVLMAITGYFIGGVANLISAAISADLGRQGPVQGNKEALATVTGIVDGTGSVGAAVGQILVPVLQENIGWHSVFYLFMIMTFLTILSILPLFIKEIPLFVQDAKLCMMRFRYGWYTGLHTLESEGRAASQSDEDDGNHRSSL